MNELKTEQIPVPLPLMGGKSTITRSHPSTPINELKTEQIPVPLPRWGRRYYYSQSSQYPNEWIKDGTDPCAPPSMGAKVLLLVIIPVPQWMNWRQNRFLCPSLDGGESTITHNHPTTPMNELKTEQIPVPLPLMGAKVLLLAVIPVPQWTN